MATFDNFTIATLDTANKNIYSSTSDSTIVLSILVSNTNGSVTQDVTVEHVEGATIVAEVAHTIPVPADASLELLANKYILPSGATLRAKSSASGFLSVATSIVVV